MPVTLMSLLLQSAVVAALAFGWPVAWPREGAQAPTQAPIEWTGQERAYLQQAAPVRMCVDPDWAPFERIDASGQHVGIAADLVQLVAQRVGLKVELYPTKTWEESLAASKAGRCQVMSFLNQTPAREQWLGFTAPIFFDPNIVVTREEHPYIGDLKGLSGQTVALPRGTMVEERIRREYPNLNVVLTESEQASVELVSRRQADMTIRSLIVAAYAIKTEGLFNLKIAGSVPDFSNKLRMGVIKTEPVLLGILDKGVATLTPQDRESVSNRHVLIQVQRGTDYRWAWKMLLSTLLVLIVVYFWMRKLARLNRELERLAVTDRLTGLFNRLKLDEVLAAERLRAARTGQAFSLIMVDMDHFKEVNDVHGHQTGDKVLTELARLLQSSIRNTDTVGRWGGEEFLIICPYTQGEGATQLADNLRQKVQEHVFTTAGRRSCSLGVSTFQAGESAQETLARCDAALYQAKNSGRNRVCFLGA